MPTDLPLRQQDPDPAYLAVAIATCVGAGVLGALGLGLGTAYVDRFMPNAELEGVFPVAIGTGLGVWIGAVFGAWAGVTYRAAPARSTTAWLLSAALPAWAAISVPSLSWLLTGLSERDLPRLLDVVLPLLILCIPPALAARALAIKREQREREETST
jgi:hypothetical protein